MKNTHSHALPRALPPSRSGLSAECSPAEESLISRNRSRSSSGSFTGWAWKKCHSGFLVWRYSATNRSKVEDNHFVTSAQRKHDRRFTVDWMGTLHSQIEGKGGQITREQPMSLTQRRNKQSEKKKPWSNSIDSIRMDRLLGADLLFNNFEKCSSFSFEWMNEWFLYFDECNINNSKTS